MFSFCPRREKSVEAMASTKSTIEAEEENKDAPAATVSFVAGLNNLSPVRLEDFLNP